MSSSCSSLTLARGRQTAYPSVYIPGTRTAGWYAGDNVQLGLTEILGALRERYDLAGLPYPVIGAHGIEWDPAGSDTRFTSALFTSPGAAGDVAKQLQQAILDLAGYFVNDDVTPIDEAQIRGYGIDPTVGWPDAVAPLRLALAALVLRRATVLEVDDSFPSVPYRESSDRFPTLNWVLPRTHLGKEVVGYTLENGYYSEGNIRLGYEHPYSRRIVHTQRREDSILPELPEESLIYVPCFGGLRLLSATGGTQVGLRRRTIRWNLSQLTGREEKNCKYRYLLVCSDGMDACSVGGNTPGYIELAALAAIIAAAAAAAAELAALIAECCCCGMLIPLLLLAIAILLAILAFLLLLLALLQICAIQEGSSSSSSIDEVPSTSSRSSSSESSSSSISSECYFPLEHWQLPVWQCTSSISSGSDVGDGSLSSGNETTSDGPGEWVPGITDFQYCSPTFAYRISPNVRAYLNGTRMITTPSSVVDVTHYIRNGNNKIELEYCGPYGWSNLYLVEALVHTSTEGPCAIQVDCRCWRKGGLFSLNRYNFWYSQYCHAEEASFQVAGAVREEVQFLLPEPSVEEQLRRLHQHSADVRPKIAYAGTVVTVDFTVPDMRYRKATTVVPGLPTESLLDPEEEYSSSSSTSGRFITDDGDPAWRAYLRYVIRCGAEPSTVEVGQVASGTVGSDPVITFPVTLPADDRALYYQIRIEVYGETILTTIAGAGYDFCDESEIFFPECEDYGFCQSSSISAAESTSSSTSSISSSQSSRSSSSSSSSSMGGGGGGSGMSLDSSSSSSSSTSFPSGDGEGGFTLTIDGEFDFSSPGAGAPFGLFNVFGSVTATSTDRFILMGPEFTDGHNIKFYNNSAVTRTVRARVYIEEPFPQGTTMGIGTSSPGNFDFPLYLSSYVAVASGDSHDFPITLGTGEIVHRYRVAAALPSIISLIGDADGTFLLAATIELQSPNIILDHIPITITVEDNSTEGPAADGTYSVSAALNIETDPWGP